MYCILSVIRELIWLSPVHDKNILTHCHITLIIMEFNKHKNEQFIDIFPLYIINKNLVYALI